MFGNRLIAIMIATTLAWAGCGPKECGPTFKLYVLGPRNVACPGTTFIVEVEGETYRRACTRAGGLNIELPPRFSGRTVSVRLTLVDEGGAIFYSKQEMVRLWGYPDNTGGCVDAAPADFD